MTASVADLLDRLHAQAFAISNLTTRPSEDRWRAQAVVWPRLALATMRAMNNVPQGSATDQELILVDSILQPIARNEWFLSVSEAAPVPNVPPDKRLVDMVRVLGGLADLLSLGLKGVVSDPAATLGLRANLLSPVMVAANWSLATAPDVPRNMNPRRHLQLVSGIGAAFAFIPPALRPGQYDDIAAVPHNENSLDAAIHTWLDASKDALATRKGLSGMTLQTIAADLSVVCAAAAATTNAAIALDQLAEDRTSNSLSTSEMARHRALPSLRTEVLRSRPMIARRAGSAPSGASGNHCVRQGLFGATATESRANPSSCAASFTRCSSEPALCPRDQTLTTNGGRATCLGDWFTTM